MNTLLKFLQTVFQLYMVCVQSQHYPTIHIPWNIIWFTCVHCDSHAKAFSRSSTQESRVSFYSDVPFFSYCCCCCLLHFLKESIHKSLWYYLNINKGKRERVLVQSIETHRIGVLFVLMRVGFHTCVFVWERIKLYTFWFVRGVYGFLVLFFCIHHGTEFAWTRHMDCVHKEHGNSALFPFYTK